MAYLHRLICAALVVFAGLAAFPALAAITYGYPAPSCGSAGSGHATRQAACSAGGAAFMCDVSGHDYALTSAVDNGSTCTVTYTDNGAGATSFSLPITTEDIPPDPQVECGAVAAGLNYLKAPLVHYGSAGLTACFGGYVISGTGAASGGGQTELYGPFKCSGTSAATCSAVPKPSTITADCPKGSYPGTVNGIQVCVPPTSTVDAPKTTTNAPPSGGGTAPDLPDAPTGSKTSEKQTVCEGQNCTTTTTFTDSGGTSTGTKQQVESKLSYCQENPKAASCSDIDASSFGGDCVAGFIGKGDALQKATAEAVNKTKCLLDPGTAADVVRAELEAATFGPQLTNTNVTIAQFDQTNPFGSTCPPDFQISLGSMLGSHTVPLSQMCTFLALLGYIALGVTLISSTVFVVRGFK